MKKSNIIISSLKKYTSLIILFFLFILYICSESKKSNFKTSKEESVNDSKNTEEPPVSPTIKILSPDELILNEEELGNAKLDKKWSGRTSNGLSNKYIKKIDKYTEKNINLELYQFSDAASGKKKFMEDIDSHFNKTRDDGNGGKEKNPFYSRKISVEKIGDSSFCYVFVSPTIEVLHKNYIISCNVTIDYIYQNLSGNDASTLKSSKEIIKKQIEKINENIN